MFSLKDKIAIITGGASGLGKQTAERFARAGAKVVVADVKDGSELAESLDGLFVKADVSRSSEVAALMEQVAGIYGKIDILCNNAGIGGEMGMISDLDDEEELDRILAINVKACLWGIKHAVPHMTDGGSIVNTSSCAGVVGVPTYAPYVISKAAVIGLTKTAALELGPRMIRVNAIAPFSMDAGMIDSEEVQVEMAIAPMMSSVPRLGRAGEYAGLQHFLASDEAAYVTGQIIALDGGYTAGTSIAAGLVLYQRATGQ
jgi:NAD(P)-dependent dehydrogenase (short-subunit alcohol dehydrogenase family)